MKLRTAPLALVTLAVTLCLSCAASDGPRALSPEELSQVELNGRVSRWLPSRFSGTVKNGSELHLVEVELEIGGNTVSKPTDIAPGQERRVSLQYIFPEDPRFESIDRDAIEWRLTGAVGEPAD